MTSHRGLDRGAAGWVVIGLVLGPVLFAGSASAYDPYDPNNCNGTDWDVARTLVVSKVIARPRINFIKSPYDDDFKAEGCPAATLACRKKSYLVTGDLVLDGKTRGDFTCVTYQSPWGKKQIWATGWVPSAALTAIAPMLAPKTMDWMGRWYHPGGTVEIKRSGDGDRLYVEGGMTVPTANDFHNGDFKAEVTPQNDTMAVADQVYGVGCQVRMQRIGQWLLVEDNGGCGGAGVTFTGLYRRTTKAAQ